jgi:GWxTD domain-containing protein
MKRLNLTGLVFLLLWGCTTNIYIKEMTKEEKITYYSLKAVATDQEIDEYLKLSPKERKEWNRIFWKKKDPTPLTEQNEFLEEHQRRLDHVLASFGSSFGSRPWDDRGNIYLIYGEPDERELRIFQHWDRSRISPQTKERELAFRSTPGWGMSLKAFMSSNPDKEEGKDDDEVFYSMFGEVWHYYKYFQTFQFEDEHLTGYYSLTPYTDIFGRTEELQKFFSEKAKAETQKEIYQHDYGGEALDYALDLVRFRSGKENYLVDINIALPLDRIEYGQKDTNQISWLRRIAFFDQDMNEVLKDSATLYKSVPSEQKRGHLLIDQKSYELGPGKYTLAIEIRDLSSQRIGIYKKDFWLPEYELQRGPVISDVELANFIRKKSEQEEKYVKNNLLVMPQPTRIFYPTQNVNFYYEIYELKIGQDKKSKYSVAFVLINFQNKKEELAFDPKVFESDSAFVAHTGTINSSSLFPGDYILAIKVRDLNANSDKVALTSFKIKQK